MEYARRARLGKVWWALYKRFSKTFLYRLRGISMTVSASISDRIAPEEPSVRLQIPESSGTDTFSLILSPAEWKDIHALAQFAERGLAYDCVVPYVTQVFHYLTWEPEELQSDPDMQAAFATIARMAETAPADGRDGGAVRLLLHKEEMRSLLIALRLAANAEETADLLYNANREAFPYAFPKLMVFSREYSQVFADLLQALHNNNALTIDLKATSDAPLTLDVTNPPPGFRAYLEGKMRDLVAQNPEPYADDDRTLEVQTDELIDKISTASRLARAPNARPPESMGGEAQPAALSTPPGPPKDDAFRARVEEQGATVSGPLSAGELRSQLSDAEWSKITQIDPELIRAEGEKQRRALTPNLRRYSLERNLAKDLLSDERTRSLLRTA